MEATTPAETTGRQEHEFRYYREEANAKVAASYRENHAHQTLDLVLSMKEKYARPERRSRRMGMWEMMEHLDSFVDDSDPDTSITQMEHAMQTAAITRAQSARVA